MSKKQRRQSNGTHWRHKNPRIPTQQKILQQEEQDFKTETKAGGKAMLPKEVQEQSKKEIQKATKWEEKFKETFLQLEADL